MDALTNEQQRFLEKFVNNRGHFYLTLNEMGLELNHVLSWRSQPYFDEVYRITSRKIIEHLKQENYLSSIVEINRILLKGVVEETITNSHTIDSNGESKFNTKRVIKKLGIPIEVLKLAMGETSLIKAIQQLLNEGVLPESVARKLLSTADKISTEMIECFGDNKDETAIDEKQAINLIKASVLGVLDDIG